MKTRKTYNLIILFLITFILFSLSCKKEGSVEQSQETLEKVQQEAVVTFIIGNVKHITEDGSTLQLKIKDILKPGTIVETGKKSFATFQISKVGVIRLIENSRLQIKDIFADNGGTVVDLKSGSVFSKIVKKPGTNYKVQTATMVASVRGTQFLVHANPKYKRISVREGSVAVTSKTSGKEKIVKKKMKATVDSRERISISSQTRTQQLVLEKYALHPFIDDVENKTDEEIKKEFERADIKDKKISDEINILQENILDKLRRQGKPLVRLYLKDGSQLIGAIEETTADDINLNTGESIISIPKSEIKRRVPTK